MEAMKRLSSMPAFHHHGGGDHQSRKKAAAADNKRATKREEEKDEESNEERSDEEEVEEVKEERDKKSLSRSKSFKMKLLQKMRKKNGGKEGSSKKEEMKRKMEREKRKDEMIKTYDKKAQLDSTTASSSHIKEIPQTVMCGMNLPGYKSHIKRSASSSSAPYSAGAAATNNRGRQGDRQSNSNNPLLINDEKERRRAEAREKHHRELRLGAVLSPSTNPPNRSPSPSAPAASSSSPTSAAQKKNENEGETAKKREKHRSSFLALGLGAKRAEAAAARSASPPAVSAGQAWVKGTTNGDNGDQPQPSTLAPSAGGECDYTERGEEGIDLMELQRQFQQVGGGAPGMIDEERRVRLAEDRVKGAARLPWWGLNASSGKEGRRKEWERFFSGFKVSELWEDDEGEDDDDDDEDEDPCRGKKVAYLTEETTVKEALDVMSERGLNALPICLKEVEGKDEGARATAAENGGGTQEDEVRERALRHLRKWRKAELARERERKQRKQRGKTVLGWIDLRDLLTFAVFKFPRPPSADIGIDEVRRQGVEFTQHKIRELVNIYGTNGAHVVNDEGTGGQGGHRIAANDRMPAVFRMLRSEKGLRVLPVYDQSQLPAESRCLVRVLDTKVVIRWLHRVVQDNRARSPFVRELANRQVRHWGAFADAILGKELIYFETEEMINNFDHFRARRRERRMSKLIVPFGSADGGSTVEVANHKKNPSPPPTPNENHSKEKLDLNKHLFTISADRSVIDAFKIIYNYKVSALGVLEKKGKERNVDDDESSSDSDSDDESTSSSSSGEEERAKRRKDQEKARGPSLKEAKAMVEAARESSSDDDDESSSESDDSGDSDDSAASSSEDELGDNTATTTTSTSSRHPSQQSATNHQRPAPPKRTTDSQALSSHTKPTRSQSDPLGLNASKRANAHDASDTVPAKAKTHHGTTATKDRKQSGSRGKRTPARITREEMVVRAAQAGKLISHLSSSDLKNFEPFAMMRCLHMSIKEYLACFKEKKPLVTCRRDTTLLQLLEKMAREEVNRVWLLADEDDDEDEDEGDKGHDRKGKQEPNKPKDNGGRPIGMISLADIITEVTRL